MMHWQRAAVLGLLIVTSAAKPASAENAAFGAAALIASVQPAITGAIRASADKQVAKINAGAQMYMTDVVARNSLALATMQAQTTMYQTFMASIANQFNQAATTTRLAMQLGTLERLSMLTMNLKQMQFEAEFSLKKADLDLRKEAIAAESLLAKARGDLLLTQAGFSVGGTAMDSGAALTVSETGVALGQSNPGPAGNSLALAGSSNTNGDGDLAKAMAAISERASQRPQAPTPALTLRQPSSSGGKVGFADVGMGHGIGDEPAAASQRPIRTISAYDGSPTRSPASKATVNSPLNEGDAVAVPFDYIQ